MYRYMHLSILYNVAKNLEYAAYSLQARNIIRTFQKIHSNMDLQLMPVLRMQMTFHMLNFMLFIFRQIAEKVECVD